MRVVGKFLCSQADIENIPIHLTHMSLLLVKALNPDPPTSGAASRSGVLFYTFSKPSTVPSRRWSG